MSALSRPSVDIPYISAMLDSAKDVVVDDHDQDLVEKITVLRGYFKLSQMFPERDYGPIVRRAARELDGALRKHRSGSPRQREVQDALLTFISAQA
jgi:hypothetical protein